MWPLFELHSCKVHVNTSEETGCLLRSSLREHRGISRDKLSLYVAFSSSCTIPGAGAKLSSPPCALPCWRDLPAITLGRDKGMN